MSNTENLDGSAAPLLEHLKELRNRIMISIGAFVVTFIIAFLIVGHIWAFLSAPICDVLAERGQECQLQTLGPQDSFFVAMKISMWGGFGQLAKGLGVSRLYRPVLFFDHAVPDGLWPVLSNARAVDLDGQGGDDRV